MKKLNFKSNTRNFHEILEFIAYAPASALKIQALKNQACFRNVKLTFVDPTVLQEELIQVGVKWNHAQCPAGGTFFHAHETVVMLLKDQDLALSALILVHELAHVRDIEYSKNRERLNQLVTELKAFGLQLLDRHQAGHLVSASELSILESKRNLYDSLHTSTLLKAESTAFEETRLFIEEISQCQKIDAHTWMQYLFEIRQKGHVLFALPGEVISEEKIKERYLAA